MITSTVSSIGIVNAVSQNAASASVANRNNTGVNQNNLNTEAFNRKNNSFKSQSQQEDSNAKNRANDNSSLGENSSSKLTASLSEQEQQQVRELSARDREVRAHEQAHANVGGRYAGSPTYSFQRGPDGKQYAVGGEVSIDVSPIAGDPQATIEKAAIVRRAALAPAQPSAQDRAVAAEATAIEQQARAELLAQRTDERSEGFPLIDTYA